MRTSSGLEILGVEKLVDMPYCCGLQYSESVNALIVSGIEVILAIWSTRVLFEQFAMDGATLDSCISCPCEDYDAICESHRLTGRRTTESCQTYMEGCRQEYDQSVT